MFALEAHGFQPGANVIDHLAQAADVDLDIAAIAYGFAEVLLDAASAALPGKLGASQRRPETEVWVAALELLEFRAIQKAALMAHTEGGERCLAAIIRERSTGS